MHAFKKIYLTIRNWQEYRMIRFYIVKTICAEWVAILKKNRLYRHIIWSREQKNEFNAFWLKNYGKKISPRWHKLYQSFNGQFNIKYIPEIIFTTKMEIEFNPYFKTKTLENKAIFELLVLKKLEKIARIPKTYTLAANGFYYNSDRQVIPYEELESFLTNLGEAVIKPTIGSSSGRMVRVVKILDGIDVKTGDKLCDILRLYGTNFIIQEKIMQCGCLAKLYNGAINTIRITTYILNGKVRHCPVALRIGLGGAEVDNIHAGGMCIYVDEDGKLSKTAYQLGYGNIHKIFYAHPDSNQQFEGYRIEHFDDVIFTAHTLHGCFPGIGMISWDITIDNNGIPVVIEANLLGQSVWFPQIISGEGIFREATASILKQLRRNHYKNT